MEFDLSTFKIKIKKPSIANILLLVYLCDSIILTVTRFVLVRFGFMSGTLRDAILLSISCLPLLILIMNRDIIEKDKYSSFIILFALIITTMVMSITFNPDLIPFLVRKDFGLERILRPDCALYAFLFFYLFEDAEDLKKGLFFFAYVDFIYLIIIQLIPALLRGYWIDIGPDGSESHFSYSLSFGYAIAFPTMIFILQVLTNKKIISCILTIIGLWCVITQGNRGALLVIIIFCGLLFISSFFTEKKTNKSVVLVLGALTTMFALFALKDTLLSYAGLILNRSGISSRNLVMLLGGSFSNDNGREAIWSTVINAIKEGGLFGYGMLGDRPFVYDLHVAGYSHNIFLELVVSYGIIGVLIISYIIGDAVGMILFCKDKDWRMIYIILFSSSCQLLLSLSFWYTWQFWAAAAVAHKYRKIKKRKINCNRLVYN